MSVDFPLTFLDMSQQELGWITLATLPIHVLMYMHMSVYCVLNIALLV